MRREHLAHHAAEHAGALAVHQTHRGETGEERLVEVALHGVPRLVGTLSEEVNLRGDRRSALTVDDCRRPRSTMTRTRDLVTRGGDRRGVGETERGERDADGDLAGSNGGRRPGDRD